jgi:ABC-type transporter Mla MlaB component
MNLPTELTFSTVPPLVAAQSFSSLNALDLSGVARCDSAGLAFLLDLRRRYPKLHFKNPPAQLRQLAVFMNLEEMFSWQSP